jgi:hypothetical protein
MKTTNKISHILNSLAVAFLFTLLFTSVLSEQLSITNPFEVAVKVTSIVAFVQGIAVILGYRPSRLAYMSLLTEVWSSQISENLYQNNDFLKYSTDHSMWVSHKTVHVPQAGSGSTVEKDRSVFPASIGSRTDTELTYSLAQYTTDPILIQNIEELQISYNKRQSILFNMMSSLNNTIAIQTMYTWAGTGATRIVRTSGSISTLNLPHSTATGSRKMITIADITAVKQILDADNVPQSGRILLVPAYMYNIDLLNISGIVQAYAFGSPVMPNGVVARLMGFDIMIRPDVVCFDNTATPVIKTINGDGTLTTAATTDQGAAIAYHPQFVAKALGSITPYYDAGSNGSGKPEYYGSIFSAEVMHGACKLYTSQKGVVSLVQGT